MSNILKGKLGYKGERGYSAYEIAVKHGYTGTEEEWTDSFLNSDNYYDKSEVDAIATSIRNDFAYLTGTFDAASSHTDIEYPTGFTIDNCMVIGLMYGSNPYSTIGAMSGGYGPSVRLASTKIQWWDAYSHAQDPTITYTYKIVLMKIGE